MISSTPVVNLSSVILSQPQLLVLSKGLGFSPTNKFNSFKTLMDVKNCAHSLTLKIIFFNDKPSSRNEGLMEYKSCEEQQFIQFMSFQKQKTLCHLKFLQQETTPMIEGPPIHSRPPILDFSQELIERDFTVRLK